MPLNIYVHDVVTRGLDLPTPDGVRVHPFTTKDDWRDLLKTANQQDEPAFLHASLQVTRWAQNLPAGALTPGLSLPDGLASHAQMARFGANSLNPDGLFAPFSLIPKHWDMFQSVFGPNLFMRPDSEMKIFTGRPMTPEMYPIEMATLEQVDRVPPETLCQVSPMQDIQMPEWRFWCVDEDPITWAPYAFDADVDPSAQPEDDLIALAAWGAQRMIDLDHLMVIDVVRLKDGTPKIVEANGFSTSGFYPGMNLEKLWSHLKNHYIM
jgi:hypothetical protein